MSSHREAPEISKDPCADSTDVYAFVSPDRPDTVTILCNYIPLEDPAGGPNFFEFGDDVLYSINIDNDGDGKANVTYEFRFTTNVPNPNTFLYNTGVIDRIDSPSYNRPQTYELTEVRKRRRRRLAKDLLSPPCNVGLRSTPNYSALANAGIYDLDGGIRVFAGQRLDGFYVDLGSIFDLAALRPFQNLHLIPTPAAPGVNAVRSFNVHTLAVQVPITHLTRDGKAPTDPMAAEATIGVWTAAYRQKATLRDDDRDNVDVGPFTQVSRLGNPLFNEVIVPLGAQGRVEPQGSAPRLRVRPVRRAARAGQAAAVPLPRRVPEPGGVRQGPRRPAGDPADRDPRRHRRPASRTSPGRRRPTCCASTWRSRRPPTPTSTGSSAATSPASRTAGACSTTSSPSSCAPSPG